VAARPADLVRRQFTVPGPDRLWVADFTYVPAWTGMVYVAFVIDACSRRILGWRAATTMKTALVLAALASAAVSFLDGDAQACRLPRLAEFSEPGKPSQSPACEVTVGVQWARWPSRW
jgi:Integrase core domain